MMRTTTSRDAAVAVTVAIMTGELDRAEMISADDHLIVSRLRAAVATTVAVIDRRWIDTREMISAANWNPVENPGRLAYRR